MSDTATIYVNDKSLKVDTHKKLIEVLLEAGFDIAHFCYHEALGVAGNCRMCMVEIEGQKRPQIACDTPIKEGMRVWTNSKNIMEVKRSILELELINHPVDCPICDQAGECSLQDYYMQLGLYESRIELDKKVHKQKHLDLGSHVMLDQERCVLCARCVRFTSDITQSHELVIAHRGDHACVTTFEGQELKAKGYAMNVVDLCPVGALTSKDFRFTQRVWFLKSDASICHECARGCNITIDHNAPKYEDDKIYRIRPRKNLKVNGHFICDTGRLSYHKLNENRLFKGRIKHQEQDFSALTAYLKKVTSEQTPLLVASPTLSLESLFVLKLFAQKHHLKLFAAEPSSFDEDFADDLLRLADRAGNRAALKLLDIQEDSILQEQALKSASFILNFSNDTLFSYTPKEHQTLIHFSSFEHKELETLMALPAFSETEGLLINATMQLQAYTSTIKHQVRVPTLIEYLHALDNTLPANITQARLRLQEECAPLNGIELLNLPPQGINLEDRL